MTIKHEGLRTYRLIANPLEQAFHNAWIEENDLDFGRNGGNLLGYLLGENNEQGVVSERDAVVAATIIQWLGSPVGQKFIERVTGA
jgi:hypothetical protein